MMTPGQLAALIAAAALAVLAVAGGYALLRLGRLLGAATKVTSAYADRADALLGHAEAVVARADEQLARTGAITASMDDVTANMAELSGHVSALGALARSLASALAAPVTGLSALAYGVRHAVALRAPGPQDHRGAQGRPRSSGQPRGPQPHGRRQSLVPRQSQASRAAVRRGEKPALRAGGGQ